MFELGRRPARGRVARIVMAALVLVLVLPALSGAVFGVQSLAAAHPVTITTLSLPGGTQSVPYPPTPLLATGGTPFSAPQPAYNFALAPASALMPAGLGILSFGGFGGTPTVAGTFTFTLRATDSVLAFDDQTYTVVIAPAAAATPVTITTLSLPGGTQSVFYPAVALLATGGTPFSAPQPAYSFALAPSSGPMPTGLGILSFGGFGGTPTVAGTFIFTLRATDSRTVFDDQAYTVVIAPAPDTTAPVIAAHGNETAEATSATGAVVTYTAPSWTDAVDGSGTASCLPASGGTFAIGTTTVTCTARDAAGNNATPTTFSVIVSSAAEQLSELAAAIDSSTLSEGRQTSLLSSLSAAEARFASGDLTAACNQLDAFIHKVKARAGKDITTALAGELITAAQRIQAVAGCP